MTRARLYDITKAVHQSQGRLDATHPTTRDALEVKQGMQSMLTVLQECIQELNKHVK